MRPAIYICTAGHIETAPSMAQREDCMVFLQSGLPCGCGVVRVPHDQGLLAAYSAGGRVAVLAAIADGMTPGSGSREICEAA